MSIEQVLKQSQNQPVDQTIATVAQELAKAPVLVVANVSPTGELDLHVAKDKQGHLWIYLYTSEEVLSKAFPKGAQFVEMGFVDALNTIGPDNRFGGMFINSASDAQYLIPRALFMPVAKALKLI